GCVPVYLRADSGLRVGMVAEWIADGVAAHLLSGRPDDVPRGNPTDGVSEDSADLSHAWVSRAFAGGTPASVRRVGGLPARRRRDGIVDGGVTDRFPIAACRHARRMGMESTAPAGCPRSRGTAGGSDLRKHTRAGSGTLESLGVQIWGG